jgi:hypothetical protein
MNRFPEDGEMSRLSKIVESNPMKHRLWIVSMTLLWLVAALGQTADGQEKKKGEINWVDGTIHASGEGTATPTGNKVRDQLKAVRAAMILAQRSLLETVMDLSIDSKTKVKNRMVEEDIITSRVEGTIRGAEIIHQNVRWEGNIPIAVVELRICLSGAGACKPETSIINALALDQEKEPDHIPQQGLNDIPERQETNIQKVRGVLYDSTRPVTGVIFTLQGLSFERVLLPVVIAIGDGNNPLTVYSVKSVEPQVTRSYGVARYADSVDQAKQNPHLGDNAMVVPVSGVTKESMIVIGFDAALMIRETTRHGNDYLRQAKVMIVSK